VHLILFRAAMDARLNVPGSGERAFHDVALFVIRAATEPIDQFGSSQESDSLADLSAHAIRYPAGSHQPAVLQTFPHHYVGELPDGGGIDVFDRRSKLALHDGVEPGARVDPHINAPVRANFRQSRFPSVGDEQALTEHLKLTPIQLSEQR
jgi:hypothetical protein